jgi:hypothetical protein
MLQRISPIGTAGSCRRANHCWLYLRSVTLAGGISWTGFLLAMLLRDMLAMLPVNLIVFGISICEGIAFRGASKGTLLAAASVALCIVAYLTLVVHYHLNTPSWFLDKVFAATMSGSAPWTLILGWSMLALALPFTAQLLLERRDVV